ncbi:hypothetical protein ACTA71_007658 [Dictyostelium dimigraforme]
MSTETETQLGESKRAILSSLIKQLAPNKEIKHMVLPCFLLQPRSTLESFTDMFTYIDELYKINEIDDEGERFLQFVKFYLTGWHTRPKGICKPFNPVIGEEYECFWSNNKNEDLPHIDELVEENNSNVGVFKAEQISHHPPLSAYIFYNKFQKILVNGNICPSYVKFLGNSAESHLQGILEFNFFKWNECFECTLPTVGVKGIILGKLSPFTCGDIEIKSKNGKYSCKLEFLYKGLFGSSKNINGIKGTILYDNKPIYKVRGNWDKQIFIKKINEITGTQGSSNSNNSTSTERCLMDVSLLKHSKDKYTKPIDQQPPNSSYHLWELVTKNINNNNDKETAEEKAKIEEKQRKEEAERREKGIQWEPKEFHFKENPNYDYKTTFYYNDIPKIFEDLQSKPVQ